MEDADGRVGPGEREYLISPTLGSVTMTALGIVQPPDSKIATSKKVFDWMSDDQFNNLQILALHYDWFQEMFERMPRDGRETLWRTLCESEQPELQPLPDRQERTEDNITPMRRMCIIRAVRSDKMMQITSQFILQVMGKRLADNVHMYIYTRKLLI